jgi:hypothetical protein
LAIFTVFFWISSIFAHHAAAQGAGNALDFDGIDDYVQVLADPSINGYGKTALTVEAWIYARSEGESYGRIIDKSDETSQTEGVGYDLNVRADAGLKLSSVVKHTGTNTQMFPETPFSSEEWHHVAFTYNEDSDKRNKVYLDGVLINGGYNLAGTGDIADDSSIDLRIGNWAYGTTRTFDGLIDEVRIWSTPLSQSTIRSWMNKKIDSSHPDWSDLEAYWDMDEGSGDVVYDQTSNANDGALGSGIEAPSWIISRAALGDASNVGTGTDNLTEGNGVPVDITWDGDDPGDDAVFSAIEVDDLPDVTSGLLLYYPSRYWELWIVNDDGSFQADVGFHYDSLEGIADESALELYGRTGPGNSWVEISDYTIFNEGDAEDGVGYIMANDLTEFSQFIITSNDPDNPLPVELSTFVATITESNVTLHWRTESEVDNLGFNIFKSHTKDADSFRRINDKLIPGTGNSPMPHDYTFIDEDVKMGFRYYYYLQDVDIRGRTQNSAIIDIFVQPVQGPPVERSILLQNFPNPANPGTHIPYHIKSSAYVEISIYDIKGQLIRSFDAGDSEPGKYVVFWDGLDNQGRQVSSGVYFYTLRTDEILETRKLVILK